MEDTRKIRDDVTFMNCMLLSFIIGGITYIVTFDKWILCEVILAGALFGWLRYFEFPKDLKELITSSSYD